MKSVFGRDKLDSDEGWCQGRKVIAVKTSYTGRGCADKYLTTALQKGGKKKALFVVFTIFYGVNTPTCPISYPYQATSMV